MFKYCKKCGMIKNFKPAESACPVCEAPLFPVPSEYLTSSGVMFASQEAREKFVECIKASDEYDAAVASQAKEILAEKEATHKSEVEKMVDEYKDTLPKKCCPVCHSTSLSKISNVGKVAKIGVFGIYGAGDLGKTWKCNSCGMKF